MYGILSTSVQLSVYWSTFSVFATKSIAKEEAALLWAPCLLAFILFHRSYMASCFMDSFGFYTLLLRLKVMNKFLILLTTSSKTFNEPKVSCSTQFSFWIPDMEPCLPLFDAEIVYITIHGLVVAAEIFDEWNSKQQYSLSKNSLLCYAFKARNGPRLLKARTVACDLRAFLKEVIVDDIVLCFPALLNWSLYKKQNAYHLFESQNSSAYSTQKWETVKRERMMKNVMI